MIVFNLTCGNAHSFEGWFGSAADFDRQQQATQLNCPLCGNTDVTKGLHAPYVNTGSAPVAVQRDSAAPRDNAAQSAPAAPAHYVNLGAQVTRMIEQLIANTEDVGNEFPEEARKIHYQEAPERQIRGNASREEVEELRDEGIEVVALPVPPHLLDKQH